MTTMPYRAPHPSDAWCTRPGVPSAPRRASGFRLRMVREGYWFADTVDQRGVLFDKGTVVSACPRQAACMVTRHNRRDLTFHGATRMSAGEWVPVEVGDLAVCDVDPNGWTAPLHFHTHVPGSRALGIPTS